MNEWRFLKLKEFRDGNVEAESEAFDRYLQNVGLLEEVFQVKPEFDNQIEDEQCGGVKLSCDGDKSEGIVDALKLKLRSNTATSESFRKRIQCIVDAGLKKVRKLELVDEGDDVSDAQGQGRKTKKVMAIALSELNDKLNKARNEEELKACWEMARQMIEFEWNRKRSQTEPAESSLIFPPKWVNPVTIDEEALSRIDAQFSSLQEIEDL